MCRYGVPRAIFNGSIFLVSWAIFFGKRTDYVYVVAEALFCCPVSFIFRDLHYAGNAFSAGVVFSQVCHHVNVDWKWLLFFLSSTIFWTDGKMSVWHVDMKAPYVRPLISISFFGDGILCFTTIVIPIKLPACRELRHERPLLFCPFSRGKHANIWLATFLRRSTQITCFSIRDEAMRAALKPVFSLFLLLPHNFEWLRIGYTLLVSVPCW